MKIEMNIKPFNKLRWKTLGDYYYVKKTDTVVIEAADTGNFVFNMLILQHELNEYMLTTAKGIKESDIKAFDEAHPNDDDPGLLTGAPYMAQHAICDAFDRILLSHLGMSYKQYDTACNKVWKTWKGK